jgi:hypothetical protein
MHSKGKPAIGLVIIEKSKSFYDKIKISDKSTCFEGGNKILPVRISVSTCTL